MITSFFLIVLIFDVSLCYDLTELDRNAITFKDGSSKIDWNDDGWATGCRFRGNDLKDEKTTSRECPRKCANTKECTHFTWTNFNGGTCWMKTGNVKENEAYLTFDDSITCGILQKRSSQINWNDDGWASGCIFKGDDLSTATTQYEECPKKCAATEGCTHYSWFFEDASCWMKKGNVRETYAYLTLDNSVICGTIQKQSNQITWNDNGWATGCRFSGNDLSDAKTKREECLNKCLTTEDCTHFTWTTYKDGTCWMKNGNVREIDAYSTFDNSIICGTVQKSSSEINWNGNGWATGCRFKGNDLSNVKLKRQECPKKCQTTELCTHFTWTAFEGGTCWMKKGNIREIDAYLTSDKNVICGTIQKRNNQINWNIDNWATGCTFHGNDLSDAKTSRLDCPNKCDATQDCTHFTWTNYEGGTCWMKTGNVREIEAYLTFDNSMICGMVQKSKSQIKWYGDNWASGCRFNGNDIGNAKTLRRECQSKCAATDGCTHFTWTTFEDGTCWMKTGNVRELSASLTFDNSMVCGTIQKKNSEISWNAGGWMSGCCFKGNDLSDSKTKRQECPQKCADTDGCTHFTWTTFEDGTCWMKKGNANNIDAYLTFNDEIMCGMIQKNVNQINWNSNGWASGCRFLGNDIDNAKVEREECPKKCATTDGCTHYTWTKFNGGTCWMKKGNVRELNARLTFDKTIMCGTIQKRSSQIIWNNDGYASGCRFLGNDITNAITTNRACPKQCAITGGCTHFTWTPYNGGTCWMKTGNINEIDTYLTFNKSITCGTTTTQKRYNEMNWNSYGWAAGCRFDNPTRGEETQRQDCPRKCAATPWCTHFTWQKGNCWMKNGLIGEFEAHLTFNTSEICGTIQRRPNKDESSLQQNSCILARPDENPSQVDLSSSWLTKPIKVTTFDALDYLEIKIADRHAPETFIYLQFKKTWDQKLLLFAMNDVPQCDHDCGQRSFTKTYLFKKTDPTVFIRLSETQDHKYQVSINGIQFVLPFSINRNFNTLFITKKTKICWSDGEDDDSKVKWDGKNWAFACGFKGENLSKHPKITTSEKCKEICSATKECTHYVWTPDDGGICYLKKGQVTKRDAFVKLLDKSDVCGIVQKGDNSQINWDGNNWAVGCDFHKDHDITSAKIAADECIRKCANTKECTHYTYNTWYNSGTCYLKKGAVTKRDAFIIDDKKVFCGVVPKGAQLRWNNDGWASGCRFKGNEIETAKMPSSQECKNRCTATVGCTHFSWSPTDNGTCHTHSGKVKKHDSYLPFDNSQICGIMTNDDDNESHVERPPFQDTEDNELDQLKSIIFFDDDLLCY